jgi:hypothetical protein
MSISVPKIFISYSWTNSEHVIELAKRLMRDGVEVVLDKWDLIEGQDKYAFMERSVTDHSIDKVLLICDKVYAEKANAREGGVGDETMVISPEVYAKAAETKFIPVIFERDENGQEYIPAYLKSRIHIDLCIDNMRYEEEYEKLLRNLHNRPENRKPALGKMPEWLNDEKVDFSIVRNLLKQVQVYDGKNKNKIEYVVRKFSDDFIVALLALAPAQGADFDEKLLSQIDAAKPLRDLYFDYIEALIMSDLDVGGILGDFFENIYNGTFVVEGRISYIDAEFEFYRFIIWEMFIGSTAILLHYESYPILNRLLHRTYFLAENAFYQNTEAKSFVRFLPQFTYIEGQIKPKREHPRPHTLAGEIAVKREKLPRITRQSLVNADMVLFQLSRVYEFPDNQKLLGWFHGWFPKLYVYGEHWHFSKQPIWSKMVSQAHCQKLFSLFGVTKLEQLRGMIEKSKLENRLNDSGTFASPASIQQSIELDKIGTMP